MVGNLMNDKSLIELYGDRSVNSVSKFAKVFQELEISCLFKKYQELVESAPHRHETGKKYFVGHEMFRGGKEGSNRKEEILAGDLFNQCQKGKSFLLSDNRKLKIIDYQFPLKARRGDKGIGKVDLFGVIDDEIPCVIELKVDQKENRKPDTPLRALLEGLAYCAIIEGNQKDIWQEAKEKFDLTFKEPRPHLIILAPEEYWSYYFQKDSAGNWTAGFSELVLKLKEHPFPSTLFISLKNHSWHWVRL